jgi:hypothetical protein
MPILVIIALLFNPFTWNTHHYPKVAEKKFLALCKQKGGTEEQCRCNLRAGEKAWTVRQAVAQGQYYLKHKRLSEEARKIHLSCLPKES